jgi:hypothetical protein
LNVQELSIDRMTNVSSQAVLPHLILSPKHGYGRPKRSVCLSISGRAAEEDCIRRLSQTVFDKPEGTLRIHSIRLNHAIQAADKQSIIILAISTEITRIDSSFGQNSIRSFSVAENVLGPRTLSGFSNTPLHLHSVL